MFQLNIVAIHFGPDEAVPLDHLVQTILHDVMTNELGIIDGSYSIIEIYFIKS